MGGPRIWSILAVAGLMIAGPARGGGSDPSPPFVVGEPDDAPTVYWPTPNPAYLQGRPFEDYVQPTATGEVVSGLFGCVRNQGRRFHEGIDLFPLRRDRRGESIDPVYAAMAGVVRHISTVAGHSSYGRYIVVEHPAARPAVITLYSHLRSIQPGLTVGSEVSGGQVIGVLGRSAGGYVIPPDRAHLHFEVGLRMSSDFQDWFDRQDFGSPNHHGIWNGINLTGFDFHDFLDRLRTEQVRGFTDYLIRQPPAVTVRIRGGGVPDFVRRYPELVFGDTATPPVGWEISFTWYGLPVVWQPLDPTAQPDRPVEVIQVDHELLGRHPCHRMVEPRPGGRYEPGPRLREALGLLFPSLR
ncbi:MAG: M23 family metallopeptidase [Puniceicoccaceae bacterium]|nr:MAG: M23 family metallopeptidase [Puniceicoccaceae bacterium]